MKYFIVRMIAGPRHHRRHFLSILAHCIDERFQLFHSTRCACNRRRGIDHILRGEAVASILIEQRARVDWHIECG